jgi:hypothetical protein
MGRISAIAFAQDREKWKSADAIRRSRPDQDGRFKMSGLTPADYYIVALEKVDSGQRNPDYLESLKTKRRDPIREASRERSI